MSAIYGYAIYNQETTPFKARPSIWPLPLFPSFGWPNLNQPVARPSGAIPTAVNTIVSAGLAPTADSRLIPTDVFTTIVDE
jgi:hypothetical protein